MRRTYSRQCPQCSRDVTWPEMPTYPFCSERCQLIDLGAWASGDYRIAGDPITDEEEAFDRSDLEADSEAEGWED